MFPAFKNKWQRDMAYHLRGRPSCSHWTHLAKEDTTGPWITAATITNLWPADFEKLKSYARISFTDRGGDTFYGPMRGFPKDKPPLMVAHYYEGTRELHIYWMWW